MIGIEKCHFPYVISYPESTSIYPFRGGSGMRCIKEKDRDPDPQRGLNNPKPSYIVHRKSLYRDINLRDYPEDSG